MSVIAIIEYVSAAFVGIALLGMPDEKGRQTCTGRLRVCMLAMLLYLLIDASAYTFVGPKYPLALRYILNLLAYVGGMVIMILFTGYCEAYIRARTKLAPWVFRVPMLLLTVTAVLIVANFAAGKLVVYQNGTEAAVNNYPLYIRVLSLIPMIYNPAVVFYKRRSLERKAVFLLGLFNIAPILASVFAAVTGVESGVVFGTVSLVLVTTLLQKSEIRAELGKASTMQALSDGLAREYHTVWLMDGFGRHDLHLYRSTGKTTVQSAVQLGLDQPCFDTSVVKYIKDNVLEEDQERVIEETRFETIARETPEVGTYVVTYRRYTADRTDYTWHQMCFARAVGTDGTVNYILAYRDADRMMREQIAQQKQLQEALDAANIEAKRNDVLIDTVKGGKFTYKISADDKVVGAVYAEISKNRIGAEYLDKMEWVELLHPEDRDRVMAAFMACVRDHTGSTPYGVTFRMKGPDGKYRWVRSGGRVIRQADGSGEFYGISLDITEQLEEEAQREKQLEEALARANEEAVLRSMIYQISDSSQWSYEVSADDEVLSVSYSDRLLETVNARPSGNAMGWVGLVHPEDRDRVTAGFMAAIRDHSQKTLYDESYRIMDMDGEYRRVRSVGRVIRRPDGTGEFIGMATDFTAQFREQELHQKQLAEALSMADAANKAKTDFLFNMSHDIRTPMNAIIGFTNIAKKEITNPAKVSECLDKVRISSDILLNLINDVLDMSRIESGKVKLHEEKYEIVEAFDSFEPAMASLAASRDIDLRFSIGTVRDRYIFADGPRFDRVLINIISNAIKYTLPGGFVKVSAEQIADTRPGYGNYRFTVTDSGIGMSEEFQKHMFEDFSREENSTTSGVQGTGLGLSLVKKLLELMGGTISCVSRQGIGTTFSIVFPFRLQTPEDRAEERVAVQEHAEIGLSGKKVLLVEDNEFNREIAGEILADAGLTVETAADGQKAVNKVREHGIDYYDFILMDIQMPIMNGFEATKIIRELFPEKHIPIIALSANAFKEDRLASISAGMDDHVAKPIDVGTLKETLARFL